jgi:hypothetical protein
LLGAQGYGLRSHRKVLHTGKPHAERDRQFRYLAAQREDFRGTGDPRISVDAKKKELVGHFKNAGQAWRQEAEKVNAHDFPQDAECRAAQYGIYDPERNEGHVCVATSSDTPDFAVDAIADWWHLHGTQYPRAKRLMIEVDSGGSNGAQSRCFKKRLQEFADHTGLEVTVCHYPPGTSKWNPIEHRLFSQITATWAGFVLSTLAVLLEFIRRTTTQHRAEGNGDAVRENLLPRSACQQGRVQRPSYHPSRHRSSTDLERIIVWHLPEKVWDVTPVCRLMPNDTIRAFQMAR